MRLTPSRFVIDACVPVLGQNCADVFWDRFCQTVKSKAIADATHLKLRLASHAHQQMQPHRQHRCHIRSDGARLLYRVAVIAFFSSMHKHLCSRPGKGGAVRCRPVKSVGRSRAPLMGAAQLGRCRYSRAAKLARLTNMWQQIESDVLQLRRRWSAVATVSWPLARGALCTLSPSNAPIVWPK